MTEQKIIGKGTWIDKLAYELVEREKQLGRDTSLIMVESGLGASGIPHIGSLGDAVRAYGVKLALENFGYKSELIAYSDDLDGLRKIPQGLQIKEENIGRRVSAIEDPYGSCHDSYGSHMSSLLLEGLNELGIKYTHKTAHDTYKNGILKEQIHKILVNNKKIGNKIEELTGQTKFQAWKVEFAARWQAFDIRFEAYGKDIMDSVKVNDWVSDEILGFPQPYHVKYELFLDKSGKKISKSLGNVVTSQKWLNYGTVESILLLLYKRITGARELGFEDIPALMDEYNELENIYFGKTKVDNKAKLVKLNGLYEYVNLLKPSKNPRTHVSYRLLIELCKIFKDERVKRVNSKLIDYGTIKETNSHIDALIKLAGNYSDDFEETKIPSTKFIIDDSSKMGLKQLADLLTKNEKIEDLQNSIYDIAKKNQTQPKDFFKILYQILLSTNRGPKIGPLIEDIGKKKVADTIYRYV